MEIVKIVTFVPETHADSVREAIGNAGGGHIGRELESVQEEKIEFVCERMLAKKVMEEIRRVHPYEEVPFDVYPLINETEI